MDPYTYFNQHYDANNRWVSIGALDTGEEVHVVLDTIDSVKYSVRTTGSPTTITWAGFILNDDLATLNHNDRRRTSKTRMRSLLRKWDTQRDLQDVLTPAAPSAPAYAEHLQVQHHAPNRVLESTGTETAAAFQKIGGYKNDHNLVLFKGTAEEREVLVDEEVHEDPIIKARNYFHIAKEFIQGHIAQDMDELCAAAYDGRPQAMCQAVVNLTIKYAWPALPTWLRGSVPQHAAYGVSALLLQGFWASALPKIRQKMDVIYVNPINEEAATWAEEARKKRGPRRPDYC
ncbi:uncharacterized protein RCC_02278 [Ramularia collo-cygni]|uniref:Uncharacterized protein n=1 Tax=Ramularia collo-cygni TaxID=112498 RepID=A0A2D3US11_9PEZI|nr:uncharacterized protein RCC_02278 [Ramularia collo-cygni]CZT16435.1 uncharacterized protein RCC_02278 [Ramularia collo-cygni]